jgi:glycosyltransferase involved in cell wall biosynthesis
MESQPIQYPKAVVVHAGNRDHYQLAAALHEADLLDTLVTDLYQSASQTTWYTSLLADKVLTKLLDNRSCEQLDGANIEISVRALGAFVLGKMASSINTNRYKDKVLSRKAMRVAEQHESSLFCYSYYASEAFKPREPEFRYRFLFQLHPHPKSVKNILTDEMKRSPAARASLMMEHEVSLPEQEFNELSAEPHLANGWVVASSYTASTLAEHGIPLERIHVVPYGVNSERFIARSKSPASDKPFTIVYVGSMSQRKGLSYLLDAVKLLSSQNVKVVLCGRGIIDHGLLAGYSNLEIEIGLPTEQLVRRLHEADVFVLPSLAEGFAHVLLEAMCCGLPVITTSHTCAPDVIENGVHGFIVPIRDAKAIAEKLEWGLTHRAELAAMGEAAAVQARLFTWDRFRIGIRAAYRNMVESV